MIPKKSSESVRAYIEKAKGLSLPKSSTWIDCFDQLDYEYSIKLGIETGQLILHNGQENLHEWTFNNDEVLDGVEVDLQLCHRWMLEWLVKHKPLRKKRKSKHD